MAVVVPAMYLRPARQVKALSPLAPWFRELLALWTLWLAMGMAYLGKAYGVVEIAGPLCLTAIMGFANWALVRASSQGIWSPLFAFRLGAMVFLGIGALVPYISDPVQLDRMMALYAYSDEEAAKLLLVWYLYVNIVLTTVGVAAIIRPEGKAIGIGPAIPWLDATRLGVAFVVVGTAYSVLIGLGMALGWISFVVPGAFSTVFQAINSVGIFLIALTAFERGGLWWLAIVATMTFSVLLGLVLYDKSAVLFPVLLVGIAVLIRRVTILRVLLVAGSLLLVLQQLQPAIEDARNRHSLIYGRGEGGAVAAGTIPERLGNVVAYFREGPLYSVELGQGLTRLTYLNVGSFLVTEYDLGIGGDTMSGGLVALVPRILWPDKPIVTDVGLALNEHIFGNSSSYVAPSTAADIYWNFGWPGVALLAVPLGALLWLGSLCTAAIVSRSDWFMMPFVAVTFRAALNVDQAFVVGVFVPAVFSLILFFILKFIKILLASRGSVRAARAPAAEGR